MKKSTIPLILFLGFVFASLHSHAQQRERLIALDYYTVPYGTHTYVPADSMTYIYSGGRSIDSAWGILQASDTTYTWLTRNGNILPLSNLKKQAWNINSQLQTDTTWYWDSTANNYFYKYYNNFSYYSNGLPYMQLTYAWDTSLHLWTGLNKYLKSYDNSGRQVLQVTESWSNNQWDTVSVSSLAYDNNGHTISYLNYNWPLSHNTTYGIRGQYSYDSLGRRDTLVLDQWINNRSIWVHSSRSLFYYDAAGDINLEYIQRWDTAGWHPVLKLQNTYDANHSLTASLEQTVDSTGSWINSQLYQATFDSYNMVTSSVQLYWDVSAGGIWTPAPDYRLYHYYYELYTPSGIAEIQAAGDIRVYPVPAADMLSLDIKWNEAQASTAIIYDMSGRMMSEYQLPNTASYHGYIPVSSLAAGVYTIQIKGATGSVTRHFNVMR
jgi:hypothetical protein